MDSAVIKRVTELERADPPSLSTIQDLDKLAQECVARGATDEAAFCLLTGIRLGTSASLARDAIPLCLSLLRLTPKRVYLHHLAALCELAGEVPTALRYYRYLADHHESSVPLDHLQALLSAASQPGLSQLSPLDQAFIAHVDLGAAYLDMGMLADAAAMAIRALELRPNDTTAKALLDQIRARGSPSSQEPT